MHASARSWVWEGHFCIANWTLISDLRDGRPPEPDEMKSMRDEYE